MKSCVFVVVALLMSINCWAQLEFSKWYFGQYAGLDFSTSPPTVLTNGIVNTAEGVATICDNSGNLLFYSDGTGIANAAHILMANGAGLNGSGTSTQSGIIVKQPGSSNLYYVFTAYNNNGVCYSIVDMSLAAGMGSVTAKNVLLHAPTSEKLVAVRHCNGRDAWIISHDYGTNNFRAHLLTSAGVSSTAVLSSIGGAPAGTYITTIGHLKVSPDGRKLAMATASTSVPSTQGLGGFFLFDFDASSGTITNSVSLATGFENLILPYGIEFSPDGTKLYGATSPGPGGLSGTVCAIYQWDACATNSAAIVASQYSLVVSGEMLGSVQRAIDNKLYIAMLGKQYLGVINNPNASGAAMNFVPNQQSIAPKTSAIGLPNFINFYERPAPPLFSHSLICQSASFTAPPPATFSSGCSSVPYPYTGYAWDFGDAASGASNSSTLSSPSHVYTSVGNYTSTLILYSPCTSDTLRKVINVSTAGPNPVITGPSAVCKGEKHVYTAGGGDTYQWGSSSTSPTMALTAQSNTIITVSATRNGCTLSRSFTVTVNPCTGISEADMPPGNLYPNPFSDELVIETSGEVQFEMSDLAGAVILSQVLGTGRNVINTSKVAKGIYVVRLQRDRDVQYRRAVK